MQRVVASAARKEVQASLDSAHSGCPCTLVLPEPHLAGMESFLPDAGLLIDLQALSRLRSGDFFDAPAVAPPAGDASSSRAGTSVSSAPAPLTTQLASPASHASSPAGCAPTLQAALSNAVAVLDAVQASYENVALRTRALYADCKSLAEEEARLRGNVAQITALLAPYDAVFALGVKLGLAVEGITGSELQEVLAREGGGVAAATAPLDALGDPAGLGSTLDRIEAGIAFFTSHPTFHGAAAFLGKYRALQARALGLLRSAATEHIGAVAAAAERELASRQGGAPGQAGQAAPVGGAAEAVAVSALQLRWRTGLVPLRAALRVVETRAGERPAASTVTAVVTKSSASGAPGASLPSATTSSLLESAALADAALASRRACTDTLRGLYSVYFTRRAPLVTKHVADKLHALAATVLAAATGGAVPPSPPGGGLHAAVPDTAGPAVLAAVRGAAVEVARLVASEHELFHTLFVSPASSSSSEAAPLPTHLRTAADAALTAYLDDVVAALPDTLRPLLLGVTSLDILCDVVDVLSRDAVAELVTPRPQVMASLGRALGALVADLRERLTFLAQNYISDVIESDVAGAAAGASRKGGAAPSAALLSCPPGAIDATLPAPDGTQVRVTSIVPGDATDYPAWMAAYVLRLRQQAAQGQQQGQQAPQQQRVTVFDSWHPTLERALTLVSKLHRVLDRASFESLAQDAAAACATALAKARARVQASATAAHGRGGASGAPDAYWLGRVHAVVVTPASDAATTEGTGPAPPGALARGVFSGCTRLPLPPSSSATAAAVTGAVDADLFFLRAVLTLREQLSPFDVHLSRSSRTLDFASTGEALASLLRGLVSGGAHLRRLDAEALVALISQGLPRVAEKQIDTKQELESLLKSACEAFIERAHALVSSPVEAVAGAHPLPAAAAASEEGGAAVPSVTPEAAAAFFASVASSLTALLPHFSAMLAALRRRLGLYLLSPLTASILFKPVRERAATALSNLRSFVHEWGARAPPAPSGSDAAASRQAVEALLLRLSAVLDASDLLAVDPLSPLYGLDDSVLAVAASGGAASTAVAAAATPADAAAAPSA